jgi:serine/threonine protein phosphatase PrpC
MVAVRFRIRAYGTNEGDAVAADAVCPHAPDGVTATFGGSTHAGMVRAVNEDGWLASPPVYLVADGMGGHRAGDVASAVVVRRFDELVRRGAVSVADVERCIAECDEEIEALADGTGPAPGSTLVAAVEVEADGHAFWLVANVGDSRAYGWSAGRLEQLSHDHSRVQELLDAGEIDGAAALKHPERHVVTRALGAIRGAQVDYLLIPVGAVDSILLCSDGVTTELDDSAIARLLGSSPDARGAAEAIVAAAVDAGGRDNVTAVVIRSGATSIVQDTWGNAPAAVTAEVSRG